MSEQRIAEYAARWERVCLSLHTLWTRATEHPEYDKKAWCELQNAIDSLVAFCRKRS